MARDRNTSGGRKLGEARPPGLFPGRRTTMNRRWTEPSEAEYLTVVAAALVLALAIARWLA